MPIPQKTKPSVEEQIELFEKAKSEGSAIELNALLPKIKVVSKQNRNTKIAASILSVTLILLNIWALSSFLKSDENKELNKPQNHLSSIEQLNDALLITSNR